MLRTDTFTKEKFQKQYLCFQNLIPKEITDLKKKKREQQKKLRKK